MVSAEDVIRIIQLLKDQNIPVWLSGGWGIDALLGEQTRPHKDLDVLMRLDDVVSMREILAREGYTLKEIWSENAQAVDSRGIETVTAFVLRDAEGHELDAHAMRFDAEGIGIPAWNNDEGFRFGKQELGGRGLIAGVAVRCISAEMQILCHTGYTLPDQQVNDLERLRARFGVKYR